jgi:hypothetical protein
MSDPAKPSRFRQAAIEARERANAYKKKRETAKAKESTRKGDKPKKNPEVAGGQPVKFFTNAQGQVIPITPASGGDRVIKTGPSLYRDPKDGTPYKIDPLAPSGLRNAWNDAPVTSKNGKLVQKITGVGERSLGEDPKAQAAAKAKEEKDELARQQKVGRVGIGASKRVVADADAQFATQTKQAREQYSLAKGDLDYDKDQVRRLEKALDEMTEPEQLPALEAQKKEIEATLAAKEKRVAELDAEVHRAALRQEEWKAQGRREAKSAIGAEEDRLKLMTNTGRREAIPQPVVKPGNEGFRPISDGAAPLLMPGMKLMPNGSKAMDALAEFDALMPNLQKVRIARDDQTERDAALFPVPAALPARALAGQLARDTARQVGKGDLFQPDGFEIGKDEIKANGQPVARVQRDPDGLPSLEMKRGAPSPSLASGNPYDGAPEYADVAPEFTAQLKGSGDDKAIAEEWRARRWSPDVVSSVINRWQAANDAERGEILAEIQPGMNEQVAKWMADPKQPMPRLNTRALWQSGQISAQEGRQLERIFYGEAPGPGEPRQAWNAFKTGDSPEAKAIRAEESIGGNVRKYNAAIDAAASKFIADYHSRNASRIDFDPAKFAEFADGIAKDTKGYYGRLADTLDGAAQSGVGSSMGALFSLAIRAPATLFKAVGSIFGGEKLAGTTDASKADQNKGSGAMSWNEIDLIHGQTGESAKGMWNFIRDRATFDVTSLWSGVEGKKLTKSLDQLTQLAGSEELTPDQRAKLGAEIQQTALALNGTESELADYYDIDNPESPAAQALNAYLATRDPVYKDALRHALTSTPRARYLEEAAAAYATANGTITNSETFGRLRSGFRGAQVAPVQEQAVEAISAGVQGVASKALMSAKAGAQTAVATGKALTWANKAALKAEQLGDWFSRVGMVEGAVMRNTAVQGIKTAGVSFVSEGMEGAITSMGTGATFGDVIDGFVQEGLGALGMGPVMATVGMGADAVAKGAAYAKDAAAVRGFVANWNKSNPTDPMTVEDWKQARAYLPPTAKGTVEEIKTALETIAQGKAVVAQAEQGQATPEAVAQVQAATQQAQAAVEVLTTATEKQQAAVEEAKNVMQEVNGIADPALREFADAAVKTVRGLPLTETEAEALERAVAGVEPGPVAPPPVMVDAKGQPVKDAPVEPMAGIPLAKRQADGTFTITQTGLDALNEAMPRTGPMIFPPDERSQMQGAGQGDVETGGLGETATAEAVKAGQQTQPVEPMQPTAETVGQTMSDPQTTAPPSFTVPITITSKTGSVRTMNIPVQASTTEQAAEMAMQKPQVRAMLKGGATATVGDIGQPMASQEQATPTAETPPPAQPDTLEPTAPPQTEAEIAEPAAKAREQVRPFARMLMETATAFGYKIVDTGLPFGFTDQWGKFHSFGTQIIDKAFPGSEVGQWIDKVGNSGVAEMIQANMSAPWFHRVWFGHDPLASVGAVIDKFGVAALPEYAGQLLKDSLTKSGIPLPGVQWLVHAGVVNDKVGTEWLSLNIGEALSSGLALMGTYRLYKRAKNGQEIAAGWAAVGILFKTVGGVMSMNPVLLLSGLADAVIVVAAKKGTLKAGFQKARELENNAPINRRDSDRSQPAQQSGTGNPIEPQTSGNAEASPATGAAPGAQLPDSGGRDMQSGAGGSRPTAETTGTRDTDTTPSSNRNPEINPNEQSNTPAQTSSNNPGIRSQSGQPTTEAAAQTGGGRNLPTLTRTKWEDAAEAALAQFKGKPNAAARAQTALAVLRRSLSARKAAFDDIRLVSGLESSGIQTEGTEADKDGRYTKVVLQVDLGTWVAQNLRMDGDVIAQIVSHEVIHAMQLREFTTDEMQDFWRNLPADLQADAYQSYFAAAIEDGRMEAEPAEWSEEMAVIMGFEAQRMLFEDRLFGQKITEAAQADPGLKQRLVDMFKRLIDRLRNLTATDPALKALIDWHTARAVEGLQRLGVQVPGHRKPSSAMGREMKNTGQRIAALREYTRRQDPNVPKWYAITDNGVVLSADARLFKEPWEARRAMAEEARRFGQWLAWDAGLVGSASIPDPLNEFPASVPYMERIWLPADVQEMAATLGWGYDTEPNPDENWFRDDGAAVAFVPPPAPPEQRTPQVRTPLPVATLVEGPVQGPIQDTLLELPARARTLEGMREAVRGRMDELEAMDPDYLTERQQAVYNRALPRFKKLLAKIEARLMPSWERTAGTGDKKTGRQGDGETTPPARIEGKIGQKESRIRGYEWRELGKDVSIALPYNASRLKPQPRDFAAAAKTLGITPADAAIAWRVFSEDESVIPTRNAPQRSTGEVSIDTPQAEKIKKVKAKAREKAGLPAAVETVESQPAVMATETPEPADDVDLIALYETNPDEANRLAAIRLEERYNREFAEARPKIEALFDEEGKSWVVKNGKIAKPGGIQDHWTPEELKKWVGKFREAGLTSNTMGANGQPMKTTFNIGDSDSLKMFGTVQAERAAKASAEAKKAAQQEDQARKQGYLAEADPAALQWMDKVFGADFANEYNKKLLSDYLTGKASKFTGMVSPRWLDGVTSLNAVTDTTKGTINFDAIKKAFESREAVPAAELPAPSPETNKPSVPDSSAVFEVIKKAYPFKGAQTPSDERRFLSKVKAELKPLGVAGWKIDSAVESIKRRRAQSNSGRLFYVDPTALHSELLANGDIARPAKVETVLTREAVRAAASVVNTEPTEAQKEAGNYQKGHVRLHGLDISIENPAGSERSGTDRDGKKWSVMLPHHYGYIRSFYVPRQRLVESGVRNVQLSRNAVNALALLPAGQNVRKIIGDLAARVGTLNASSGQPFTKGADGNLQQPADLLAVESFTNQLLRPLDVPIQFAGDSGFEAKLNETAANGAAIASHLFGDPRLTKTLFMEGFDSLNIQDKAVMQARVISRLQDLEVFGSIIQLVPVDVMNMVIGGDLTDYTGDNQTMLFDRLPIALQDPIAISRFIDAVTTHLPIALASTVAELPGVVSQSPWDSGKLGTTKVTGNSLHSSNNNIIRPIGKDGDHVDVFIGPKPEGTKVFIVDQIKQGNGHFDEQKIMLGFETLDEARAGYESSFTPGWKVGPVFETSLDDLKAWIAGGDLTKKASEQFEPATETPSANEQDESPFMRERNATIKASKEAGNVHLDAERRYVENSRGREIYNVHDPKERGIIRTVSNQGEVVVHWSDKYSGEKNLAAAKTEKQGRKTVEVLESWLMPTDLVDYVFADPSDAAPLSTVEKAKANARAKKAKKPTLLDKLEAYFQPGALVEGYSGTDKVISFRREGGFLGSWGVNVIRVTKDGQPLPNERERQHSTQPDMKKLDAAWAKKQEATQAQPEAPAEVTPTAPAETPEPVSAVEQAKAKARAKVAGAAAAGGLTDFGEKLGGARKDKVPTINAELTDSDIAGKTLSQIWPKSEIDSIEDIPFAALATAMRDEIPTKPQRGYKLNAWVAKVKLIKGLMQDATTMGVEGLLNKMRQSSALLGPLVDKIVILQAIDRAQWGRVGTVRNYPDSYIFQDGTKVPKPWAEAKVDDRSISAGNLEELTAAVIEKLGVGKPVAKMEFEVRGVSTSKDNHGNWRINKKGDPLRRTLKSFPDTKAREALDFVKNNHAELVAAWEKVKERDNVKETDLRTEENRPRRAQDYRQGKDVTPEDFQNAFGFRGVEFGNWVSQGKNAKERQGMINEAFDAFHDLAGILKVPTRALSLGGQLGMGFGSRGHGWASAHYEPDTIVINLTKTRGAGTLAHEFFHGLDHYFGRARGASIKNNAGVYITNQPETRYVNTKTGESMAVKRWNELNQGMPSYFKKEDWKLQEGVRPEVEESFAALVKALDDSPMAKRARLNDKGKSDYWGSTIERAARAFENYIIHKMQVEGYHNDYLANVVPVEGFVRDPGRYPYLLENEIEPVAKAFDDLFATIKTKDDGGKVVLYAPQPIKPLTRESVFAHRLATAKEDIAADMANGTIPEGVRSFAGLQDHVDANEYVNDAERPDRQIGPLGKQLGWGTQEYVNFTGELINALDKWLKGGRKGEGVSLRAPQPVAVHLQQIRLAGQKQIQNTRTTGPASRPPTQDVFEDGKMLLQDQFYGRIDRLEAILPGSRDLIQKNRLDAGFAKAAVAAMMDQTMNRIVKSFGSPKFWSSRRKKLRTFLSELIPAAARLEVETVDPNGNFVFKQFERPVTLMLDDDIKKQGLKVGDPVPHGNGVVLTVGPRIPERGGHVLTETMLPQTQADIYEDFTNTFPEGVWVLDEYLAPGMEGAMEVGPGGTTTPIFNRSSILHYINDQWPASLQQMFTAQPMPPVMLKEGWTPDIAAQRTAGHMIGALFKNFVAAARRTRTGERIDSGDLKNLLEGFEFTAFEAVMEKQRLETRRRFLNLAAKPAAPPSAGLLREWLRGQTPMDDVLQGIMRHWVNVRKMDRKLIPTKGDPLTVDQKELATRLVGDAVRFWGQDYAVPRRIYQEMMALDARAQITNKLLRVIDWFLSRYITGLLVNIGTIAINYASNKVMRGYGTTNRLAYAITSASHGDWEGAKLGMLEFGHLLRGSITDRLPGVRQTIRNAVPDEIYDDSSTFERDGVTAHEKVWDNLKDLNPGAAFLQAVNYSAIDSREKVRFTHALLRASADVAANKAGLKRFTKQRSAFIRDWLENSRTREPEAFQRAFQMTQDFLLDMAGNAPAIIDPSQSTTELGMVFKKGTFMFWRYIGAVYGFGAKQSLGSAANLFSKKLPAEKRAQAAANLLTAATVVLFGALLTGDEGDDDEDPLVGRTYDDRGQKLSGAVMTGDRINASGVWRRARKYLQGWGIPIADDGTVPEGTEEMDVWVKATKLPIYSAAVFMGHLANRDTIAALGAFKGFGDDITKFGPLVDLNPFTYEIKEFNEGKPYTVVATDTLFDILTAPIMPPRLRQSVVTYVDPNWRLLKPEPAIEYKPGPLEALKANIPWWSLQLPIDATYRDVLNAPFDAAAWRSQQLSAIKSNKDLDVMQRARLIVEVNQRMPVLNALERRQLEILKAVGVDPKFLDRKKKTGVPWPEYFDQLKAKGVGAESIKTGEETIMHHKGPLKGTTTTHSRIMYPDPERVGNKSSEDYAFGDLTGVNIKRVKRGSLFAEMAARRKVPPKK